MKRLSGAEWNAINAHVRAQERFAKQMKERALEADQEAVSAEFISVENYRNPIESLWSTVVNYAIGGFWLAYFEEKSAPRRKIATFRVRYASGRIGKETVDVGDKRFYELVAVLRD